MNPAARSWPGPKLRGRTRQQSSEATSKSSSGCCRRALRTVRPGHVVPLAAGGYPAPPCPCISLRRNVAVDLRPRQRIGLSALQQYCKQISVIDAGPFWGACPSSTDARRWRWQPTSASADVDRSRKVSFRRTGRKHALTLVLRALTVRMTVNFCRAALCITNQ
jgi:hypothetical protein